MPSNSWRVFEEDYFPTLVFLINALMQKDALKLSFTAAGWFAAARIIIIIRNFDTAVISVVRKEVAFDHLSGA